MPNTEPRRCSVPARSICQKAERDSADFVGLACLTEQKAREAAAELGRKVCGTCVSHLYATPD